MLKKNFKIQGLPKPAELEAMVFGRQIEYLKKIKEFQSNAKSVHLSMKRRTVVSVIREAIKLYNASEYYCQYHDDNNCRDDVFEFWYR